jgi:hypothetical protein
MEETFGRPRRRRDSYIKKYHKGNRVGMMWTGCSGFRVDY